MTLGISDDNNNKLVSSTLKIYHENVLFLLIFPILRDFLIEVDFLKFFKEIHLKFTLCSLLFQRKLKIVTTSTQYLIYIQSNDGSRFHLMSIIICCTVFYWKKGVVFS